MADLRQYLNVYSPLGVQINNPSTQYNKSTDLGAGVDFDDEDFKSIYDAQAVDDKREMLEGFSNEHALKILERRRIFKESQKATAEDGMMTQLALGGVASLVSPTTAIPLGAAYKFAQVGSKVNKIVMGTTIGAAAATAANLADEALIGQQGMPTNYGGVAMASIALGGGLGFLSGVLSGPGANVMAKNLHKDGDVIMNDFAKDNYVIVDQGTNTLLVPKQLEKGLVDKIPYLGDWLSSDITKLYQSDSSTLRGAATRIANATVAQRDANGNFIAIGETGMDFKRKMRGMYNSQIVQGITESFNEYKEKGGKLSRDDFNMAVHKMYTSEGNRLGRESDRYAKEQSEEPLLKLKEEFEVSKNNVKLDEAYYVGPSGKQEPLTPEVTAKLEQDKAAFEEATNTNLELQRQIDELNNSFKDSTNMMGLDSGISKSELNVIKKELQAELDKEIAKLESSKVAVPKYIEPAITLKKRNKKQIAKEINDLETAYKAKQEKLISSKVDEYYANNKPNFAGADSGMLKAIEKYQKYYDDMLEVSQKLGVKELAGVKPGRLYAPRTWDFQKIRAYDETTVKARLKEALSSDTRNAFKDEADLAETVDELYALFKSKDIESRLGQGVGYLSKNLPFTTKLKSRNINVDESKLGDLVRNNMEEITGQYHYFNSGIQSVYKAFGTDDLSEIVTKLEKESLEKGIVVSNKELLALRNSIEDLLGTLRVNQLSDEKAWTFSRNLMTFNSATLMGGAGGNQIIEMMTVTMMNAMRGNFILKHTKSWKNAADLLYREKDPKNGLSRFIVNSGFMESALNTHRVNKVGDVEAGFKESWVEKKLHSVNDFQMKYNGMRYFTAVLEDMTGGAIMDYLIKGNATPDQLARWGLDKAAADDLGKTLKNMMSTKNGTYNTDNFDLSKLTDLQRDRFQLAISRGIEEFVIQADSIHAPTWFKTAGPMTKLLTQFMRFPLIAQEVLLRRGFREDKAAMVAGIIGSSMAYMSLKYLREQASIAIGLKSEYDAEYDYSDPESLQKAMFESLNYAANLGILTTIWNYGATAVGKPELGREWVNGRESLFGPSASIFTEVLDIAERGVEGDFTSERQYLSYKRLLPLLSVPGVSEGTRIVVEELGD